MSRLIEELKRIAEGTTQVMGFRVSQQAKSETRILLLASLALNGDIARLTDGADAVLLRPAKSVALAAKLQKAAASLADTPWGGWLESADSKKMEALVEAGCDFVVFPADRRISTTPQNDEIGKILQIDPSLSDGLLRTVNDLPVDAVLATNTLEANGSIAWHHLMLFQRLANLLTKPVLASITPKVTADELKSLWEAGVVGVVIEVDAGQPAGRLKELRWDIGKLTFRTSRKRSKTEALLPYVGGRGSTATEVEEEDEEEE